MNYIVRTITILSFLSAFVSAEVDWLEHTIASPYNGPSSIITADIDRDNFLDIIATAVSDNRITWWKNSGGFPIQWTEFDIDFFSGAAFAFPIDIDQDSTIDIAAAAWYGNEIAWWKNSGSSPIIWTKYSIDASFAQAHEVFCIDVDSDGDIDIVAAGAANNEIAWWSNEGGDPIIWTKRSINTSFGGARSVCAADLNGDSLIEICGAALTGNQIAVWYAATDSTWTKQAVDAGFTGAHMVRCADIDSDDDYDLIAVAYMANDVAWWRNDGGTPVQWVKQTIDGNFLNALGVCAADVDGDDDLDVLATADALDQIAWWENNGQIPINWTKHIITPSCDGAWPVYAADLDNDDDIDVLAGAYTGDEITWWENTPSSIQERNPVFMFGESPAPTIIAGPLPRPENVRYTIYDITGQEVHSLNPAPGIYFLSINDEIVKKMVKIK